MTYNNDNDFLLNTIECIVEGQRVRRRVVRWEITGRLRMPVPVTMSNELVQYVIGGPPIIVKSCEPPVDEPRVENYPSFPAN